MQQNSFLLTEQLNNSGKLLQKQEKGRTGGLTHENHVNSGRSSIQKGQFSPRNVQNERGEGNKQALLQKKTRLSIKQSNFAVSRKDQPQKKEAFSQKKISEARNEMNEIQQKNNSHGRGRQSAKRTHTRSYNNETNSRIGLQQCELQIEKKSKKQQKQGKKTEKFRVNYSELNQSSGAEEHGDHELERQNLSKELLQTFASDYPYYLNARKVAFPIEDSLFLRFPELRESNSLQHGAHRGCYEFEELPAHFHCELQIWNILKEHPAFFGLTQEIMVEDVEAILKNRKSPVFQRVFKAMHYFYISDILLHKYDESSGEEYYSFISLWKYCEENNLLNKIFLTSWNKFITLYISLNKNHYNDRRLRESYERYEQLLQRNIEEGLFNPPESYEELLRYLLFLINMCFQTYTFRSLINDKMLFFRDNNKMKNELLEEKKSFETLLWQLKEGEKNLLKKEKNLTKIYKKEQKSRNSEQVDKLSQAMEELANQKSDLQDKRQQYNDQINSIENKVYELCCLPEFSNVWLLGEDRFQNQYWFIKDRENCVFREERGTAQWAVLRNRNIDLFQQTLNLRGIREKKLYEKILYYKQLGYLKTSLPDREEEELEEEGEPRKQLCLESEEFAEEALCLGSPSRNDSEFDDFSYTGYRKVTPQVIRLMILKSEFMMTKYLYERNSKWTTEQNRQEYIARMSTSALDDLESLTQDLRLFNEKICVVEINIKVSHNGESPESGDLKTRKIQTKIWGINEKYKHFWYDYSRKCKNLSDLHFLVSILYLTIEKYVTKTRKPNNTKYFFKTVEFGQSNENCCGLCQATGQLQLCSECDSYFHYDCLSKHIDQKESSHKMRHTDPMIEIE